MFNKFLDIVKSFLNALGFKPQAGEAQTISNIGNIGGGDNSGSGQIFSAHKTTRSSKGRGEQVILADVNPQEYKKCLDFILNTTLQGQGSVLFKELEKKKTSVLLKAKDWIKVCLSLKEARQSEMPYKIELSDLLTLSSKDIFNFFNEMTRDIDSRNSQFNANWPHAEYFLTLCENAGFFNTKEENTVNKSNLPCIDLVVFIKIINDKWKNLEDMPATNAVEINNCKKVSTFLKQMSLRVNASHIGSIVDNVTGKGHSVFENLIKNQQTMMGVKSQLSNALDEIQEKAAHLDKELADLVITICTKAKRAQDNISQLDARERVLLKNRIEIDLPTLIFNYLSLPLEYRDKLMHSDTKESIKTIFTQSLKSIQTDILSLDKTELMHEKSAKAILATRGYLHSSSGR